MKVCHRILFLIALTLLIYPDALGQRRKKRKKQVNQVVATAKNYIGTPYRWGGNSRKGIDCSGLIFQAYKSVNISLPRTAKKQSKIGKKVGWRKLRKGDIVTFKFKEKGEKWWHAGIVDNIGKSKITFIHASSSRGVTEADLLSKYWKKRVKNFRRMIK